MLNIIKADLYRILRGKTIYVVILIITALTVISVVTMSPGSIGIQTNSSVNLQDIEAQQKIINAKSLDDFRSVMKEYQEGELDKAIVGGNINLYYFFIVIVVIVLCTDFSNKTIKNTLSSAISRRKYYFSKLLLIIGLCTIIVLYNNYFTYFLNLMINGEKFASNFGEFTKITLMQFPIIYGIISLLVCFAALLRKKSSFNTLAIPFLMIVQIVITIIVSVFRLNGEIFYKYEVQYILTNLVNSQDISYIINCFILGIIYILVFNAIGYLAFKKAEIK